MSRLDYHAPLMEFLDLKTQINSNAFSTEGRKIENEI